MKTFIKIMIFTISAMLYLSIKAYANIAPLKVNEKMVEPFKNPGVKIDTAAITVTPEGDGFRFTCKYTLQGLSDIESLTLGIPGDLGYTLEAGYIDNINVNVNGSPLECKVYDATDHPSDLGNEYGSSFNFKWHTFTISIKKNEKIDVYITYNMQWRLVSQNKTSSYHIVPFILSTDKMFDSIGNYTIKYVNDDYISPSDVKVMMNSMLEPSIISKPILSPKWNDIEILWEFNDMDQFQDFRLILLSFKDLAMGFSTGTDIDHSIRWAVLNNNYEGLASSFEDISKGKTEAILSTDSLTTAAYISSEFYFRIKNYEKALEVLSPYYKSTLWPAAVKYEYINAVKLKEDGDYYLFLDELKKLSNYRDYILISSYSNSEMGPAANTLAKLAAQEVPADYEKAPPKRNNIFFYVLTIGLPLTAVSLFIAYRRIKG